MEGTAVSELTLVLNAGFAVVAALVYALVGREISSRQVDPSSRGPLLAFATWWYGLAATTALGGALSLAYAAGVRDLSVFFTASLVSLLLICLILWCLLYYLLYLFTGSKAFIIPLTAFYVLFYFALVYLVNASHPIGLKETGWAVTLDYQDRHLFEGNFARALVLLIVGPQFLGAAAYFTLFFRTKDPTARYRILLVSGSIIVWFGSVYAASAAGIAQDPAWQAFSRLLGLAAAVAVLLAYHPPPWIQRRFEVAAIHAPERR